MTEWQRGPSIDACNHAISEFMAGFALKDVMKALRKDLKDAEERPEPPDPDRPAP